MVRNPRLGMRRPEASLGFATDPCETRAIDFTTLGLSHLGYRTSLVTPQRSWGVVGIP